MIGGNIYKGTIETGATADNLAALGKVTRTGRQVRLENGRCGEINAQFEVVVKFGHKPLTMSC